MKRSLSILLIVTLLASLELACSLPGIGSDRLQGSISVEVMANTSLSKWLEAAIESFDATKTKTSDGKPIRVTLNLVEAGQAVIDLAASEATPALWIPDEQVWADVLADKGNTNFQGDCVSVARSPLVIALWRPIAEALGWPGRSLGWLDIGSLAADPSAWAYYSGGQFGKTLRLGHTHPGLSSTGADTLLAVVQAALSKTEAVSVEDIQQPIVQASVSAFEGTVSTFGTSTDALGRDMRQRGVNYLGAAVMYESTVIQYASGDPQLVPIYPFEGTFVATHPACLNKAEDNQTQEAARLFREYLVGEEAQRLTVASGLRPVNPQVSLGSPLDEAHGADPSQPKVIFNPPSVATIYAVQTLWQAQRKHVNLVMIVDTSGSMKGSKIQSVQAAAEQFVKQMGDEDFLTLLTFESRPVTLLEHLQVGPARDQIIAQIEELSAQGSTPLYDAIAEAAAIIGRNLSSQTTNAMIVLSDGLDTSSESYHFEQSLIDTAASHDTTVFTIAYGSDADEDILSKLAVQANGNFYPGSEANIAAIYEEMSAVFGGSLGVGR